MSLRAWFLAAWLLLDWTTPAGAEQHIKHSKHGPYPAAWTDYHGYHGKQDIYLQAYRMGLMK